jgi:hypothetical protein
MSGKGKPKAARELLADGWKLTQRSMALIGMHIPNVIEFQMAGERQIHLTRLAQLDDLAKGIGAVEEDIGRLVQGAPALIFRYSDIDQLRQDKAALIELQKRAARSGCPGSTTVIQSLFPDIPPAGKTASQKAEIEQWRAMSEEAGLKIDPATAEVKWAYGQTLYPCGFMVEWELPGDFHQSEPEYWARSPESDAWVAFSDLPADTRDRLRKRQSSELVFPAGLDGMEANLGEEPT